MNTVLWILFILLISIGLIYIGGFITLIIMVWCYSEDPNFLNRKIQPLLTDIRDWVDAGNRIWNYPADRLKDLT